MSRLQSVKVFVHQRLTAAVEDIIGHLETTITEYEEELCRRRRRHDELLETSSSPELRTTEVPHQLLIKEETQDGSPSLDHSVKEEQEVLWTSQEVRSQLQGRQEDMPNLMKSEDEEEKDQSSPVHQRLTEEDNEAEPPASNSAKYMEKRADGEDCGGSELVRVLVCGFKCPSGSKDTSSHASGAGTEASGNDGKEIRKPQTHLNTMKNKVLVSDVGHDTGNKSFSCSKCGRRFGQKHHLQAHMRCHTGEKPFRCSLCGKQFSLKGNLTQHLVVHTRQTPCSCPVCGETFSQRGNLTQHMTVHKREKRFC